MKKQAIAVAALAVLSSTASAQSALGVYGIVDVGLVRESGAAAGSVNKLTSGIGSGSRLGFKGNEELGSGLAAIFVLENGFQADTGATGQGGALFGRQAYVGLTGHAGTLTAGRQYTPQYLAVVAADPFGSGFAGDTKNLIPATGNAASRMDNTIKYVSPALGGVTAELAYGAGEVAGSNASGRQIGAALAYVAGPLALRLAHHNRNNDSATVHGGDNAKNTIVTAVYDAGVAKAHFAYGSDNGLNSSPLRNTGNPFGYAAAPAASTDSRDLMLGVTVPAGRHTWLASYIRKDDRRALNQDADQIALGYRYALSKRTDLYAALARIDNKRGAGYTVGSAIEGGSGNRAIDLGVRHAF